MGGWKTYAVKEKLKLLREKLRWWNKDVFGFLDLNIQNMVREINMLDDVIDLGSYQEVHRRKELSLQFCQ